jgi:Uma2 family endonuclease
VTQLARQRFTFDEYVRLEDASEIKHEYFDGTVYAMAGGGPEHAAIAANVIRLLGTAIEGKRCRVFTSDLRVRVVATGLATYPDATVVCGTLELDPEDGKGHTAINPTLLVEVTSPSTEDYDHGERAANYKRIESLREIALVAHDERRVDVWRRIESRWTLFSFHADDEVDFASLDARIPVAAIYSDPLAPA